MSDPLRVRLIHWNAAEARLRLGELQNLGFVVDVNPPAGPEWLRDLRQNPPDVVVIDLSRLPSQGRDFGLALRFQKATRYIPLVFAGGALEKVERVRQQLPDAVYTTWEEIGEAVHEAVAHPPQDPVYPQSTMDGYRGKPLVTKLGIKPGMRVGLLSAPKGFTHTLGSLPAGVVLLDGLEEGCELLIWFVRSRSELDQGIASLAIRRDFRSLWIAWQKKGAGAVTDVTQNHVREAGLTRDLVDYKISSLDETWSGLLFSRRKGKNKGMAKKGDFDGKS